MKGYDIFEQSVPSDLKGYFNEDLAQTTALLEASNLIHEAMEEKGLNQSQLADMIGVSRAYVSRILSGSENLSVKNIARILHVLGKRYIQAMHAIPVTSNSPGRRPGVARMAQDGPSGAKGKRPLSHSLKTKKQPHAIKNR